MQMVLEWMKAQGFVRSDSEDAREGICVSWEIAWGSDSGYGYITLRAAPHAYGWGLVLLAGNKEAVAFGTIRSVPELMAVYGTLSSLSWDRWNEDWNRSAG